MIYDLPEVFTVRVTTESNSTVSISYQAEFLYGPPGILFNIEPRTLVSKTLPQAGRDGR